MNLYLLTESEVRERLSVSRSTFWEMRKRGEFPEGRQMKPGSRKSIRWVASEVDAWIRERMGL